MPQPLKSERLEIRVTRDTIRELKRQAREQDISVGHIVRRALNAWISTQRPPSPQNSSEAA